MEETSPEKNELNYIFPPLFSLSNYSNIYNSSLRDVFGSTFDGLQPPGYSGLSLQQNSNSSNDKFLNSAKNSAEMLKSFKQQWYKPKDDQQYKHLPFRTNICKKAPKMQHKNNSLQIAPVISSPTMQEVSQVANVAPADPAMLEKILNDPPGYINVQGKLREVRFYEEKSIVMMDWNDPRDVCFQSSSRRVIIDDKDIIILSFNSPYTSHTFPDGSTVKLRLGAPTRDFYIDGKPVDIKFGGPPVNILVGDSNHKIQLGGPIPKVYVGNVKRSDIMAGRINLIIDEDLNNIFHIYLDPKPQKIDINGVPFILRFADSLQTVFINERPFKIDFGGAPVAVKLYNDIHLWRFSALPPGIIPGLVHIDNMESKQTEAAVRNLFPFILPWNDPKLTSLTVIANSNHYNFNYSGGEAPRNEIPTTQNTNPTLSYEKTSDNQQCSTPDPNGIDVVNLYKKLVEKGIIQPLVCEKQGKNNTSKRITVDFTEPETLKLRNMRIVYELYTGAQCEICSLRFTRKSGVYASHLDWHYQIKMHSSDQQTNWWCHNSEFPRSEQDVGHISWFEKQKSLDPFSVYEKLTVPAKDFGPMPRCSFCNEEFNQFYDEITDDWLLRNAVVHNRNLCHPICCLKENEHNITWLRVEMNVKKEVSQENDSYKISNISHGNTSLEKENVSSTKLIDTVLTSNLVDDRIPTDDNVNKLPNNETKPLSPDHQDNDISEVVVILPEMETVDLSKDEINHLENNPTFEMDFHESFPSCDKERVEGNEEDHQQCEDLLNLGDQDELAEPSLITDYKTIRDEYDESSSLGIEKNDNDIALHLHSSHSLYDSDSEKVCSKDPEDKEVYFSGLSRSPETVKPLIKEATMTVQPDVIKGEIFSSTCSIM